MTYLSQRDPKWAGVKLGSSNLSVGQWGCALTSLVNLANALGANKRNLTPGDIAHDVSCFTDKNHPGGAGLILWDKVCEKMGGIKFTVREEGERFENILRALKDPKRGVIVQVNNGAHFATVWRRSLVRRNDFIILDPWVGKLVSAKGVYHNISGARYFEKV